MHITHPCSEAVRIRVFAVLQEFNLQQIAANATLGVCSTPLVVGQPNAADAPIPV